MNILYLMIPIALLLAVVFLSAFIWCTYQGQFDDLDSPPNRIFLPETKKGNQNHVQKQLLQK